MLEPVDLLPDVSMVLYNERIIEQREEIKRLKEELRMYKEKRIVCIEGFNEVGYITIYPDSDIYNKSLRDVVERYLFDLSHSNKYKNFRYNLEDLPNDRFVNFKLTFETNNYIVSSYSIYLRFIEMKQHDTYDKQHQYLVNIKSSSRCTAYSIIE